MENLIECAQALIDEIEMMRKISDTLASHRGEVGQLRFITEGIDPDIVALQAAIDSAKAKGHNTLSEEDAA